MTDFDIIVVGGGHAGCESALIASKMGCSVLLVTINLDAIGAMSCNPSVGGPAKGHIVREIDALGGYMGKNADKTCIQVRQVNTGRGPAVRTLRMQSDREQYKMRMKEAVEKSEITVMQGLVCSVIVHNNEITGIVTKTGQEYRSKKVIIAAGTFLNGLIHIGKINIPAGRLGEKPSEELAENLKQYFASGRLKTGTPPRVDKRTIDFSKCREQSGEQLDEGFSHFENFSVPEQVNCYVTTTNSKTHSIIEKNMHLSPLYSGEITGTGPRYCPSIEDKLRKFSGKDAHKVFIEPEGIRVNECYLQGLSTSLPEEVQYDFVRSISGLENAEFFKPAYAIEYDYFFPEQLYHTLETRNIKGLYFVGQINGTSGYEEAACQGLMAGINAAQAVKNADPFILSRDESYIGILIDDLVSRGTQEPYRMFTARAESRLLLRHNNALYRLYKYAANLGILSADNISQAEKEVSQIKKTREFLKEIIIKPDDNGIRLCEMMNTGPVSKKTDAFSVIRRPDVKIDQVLNAFSIQGFSTRMTDELGVIIKYEGYIKKEMQRRSRIMETEDSEIPADFDYQMVSGLATEARMKLVQYSPHSLKEAASISGVNPVDIYILADYLRKNHEN